MGRAGGEGGEEKKGGNKKPGPVAGAGFLGWERIYSFLSPSALSFLSFLSPSAQPPQPPAKPELRETIEVARPNKAIRMNLFILKIYPAFPGMQIRGSALSAERPVEEVQADEKQDDSEDPAPVLFGHGLADLPGLDGGFRMEDG